MHYHAISRPFVRGVGTTAALVALMGCASGGETAPPDDSSVVRDVTTRDESAPGPVVIPREEATPAPAKEQAVDDADEEAQEAKTRVFRDPTDPPRREDGRPLWWFEDVERDGGIVRVCAEAIGESILQARRNAIARGRARAGRLGLADGSIEYERIWIWPTRETGQVRTRYAAFVMLRIIENE